MAVSQTVIFQCFYPTRDRVNVQATLTCTSPGLWKWRGKKRTENPNRFSWNGEGNIKLQQQQNPDRLCWNRGGKEKNSNKKAWFYIISNYVVTNYYKKKS